LLLREALPLRQQQGLAAGGLQFVNELPHARAEVGQIAGTSDKEKQKRIEKIDSVGNARAGFIIVTNSKGVSA